MTTAKEVEEILARAEAATEGPWFNALDQDFLNHARTDLPKLARDYQAAMEQLNQAGAVLKLVEQIGLAYTHPGGSTVSLSGVPELLKRVEATVNAYARP